MLAWAAKCLSTWVSVVNVPGEQLHLLLEDLGLWLPSTFEDAHSGQTWSYMHKRGGATTRPDFLALPLAWRAGTISSWVDPDIHAGQACLDHLAVLCDVHVQIAAFEGQGPRPRAKLDETAIMDPKNRQVVEDIVMSAPQIPWSTSAHAHAALLAKHLQQGLGRAFPLQAGKRAHHFLSEASVDLRLRLAKARRACSRLRTQVRNQILIITLRAWKDGTGAVPLFGFLCSPWARAARFAGARQSALVGDLAKQLRVACHADRAGHLERLADEINEAPGEAAYHSVHRLLGHKRKKPFTVDVLPTLLQRDGSVCRDADEIRLRWREHFSDLEAGTCVSPQQLLQSAVRPKPWCLPSNIALLPNVVELQQALCNAPLGKAVGADSIPNGVGRAAPVAMAQALLPLSLKLTLRGAEAVGYKSGLLHHMYKGKGDRRKCESHRGILLIPHMSKIIHKTLRPRLAKHFEEVSLSLCSWEEGEDRQPSLPHILSGPTFVPGSRLVPPVRSCSPISPQRTMEPFESLLLTMVRGLMLTSFVELCRFRRMTSWSLDSTCRSLLPWQTRRPRIGSAKSLLS